jgi:hypothetical protein
MNISTPTAALSKYLAIKRKRIIPLDGYFVHSILDNPEVGYTKVAFSECSNQVGITAEKLVNRRRQK